MPYERSALGGCFNLAGMPEWIVAVTGKMSARLLKDEGRLILILTEATRANTRSAEGFKEWHAWSRFYSPTTKRKGLQFILRPLGFPPRLVKVD